MKKLKESLEFRPLVALLVIILLCGQYGKSNSS